MEEPEEEDELQAVAKHFGKDLNELTLEALIKLEQRTPEEEGDPKRKAPSLASILGKMPSAATLGLNESIRDCIGGEKENGECSQVFFVTVFVLSGSIELDASFLGSNNPRLESH